MDKPKDPTSSAGHDSRKTPLRSMLRDPVEHGLWDQLYPIIAQWDQRPYFKDVAFRLQLGAAAYLFAAKDRIITEEQSRKWREVQAYFIAVTEYKSVGAVGNRLAEHGDEVGAANVRAFGARIGPKLESAQRKEERIRADLKQLLEEGGLSTLLADERFVPLPYSQHYGDVPVAFSVGQTSLIGEASLRVKDLFASLDDREGIRIVCDMYPPAVHCNHHDRFDQRVYDCLPSRRLFDWFGHIPERWTEFQHYHHRELHADHRGMLKLLQLLSKGPTTLLHLKRGEYSIALSLYNYLLSHYPHVFSLR